MNRFFWLASIFVMLTFSNCYAEEVINMKLNYNNRTVNYSAGRVYLNINGETINNDTLPIEPLIIEGNTLVPVREIFEKLGATVTWTEAVQTIEIMYQSQPVVIKIGSSTATVIGKKKTMSVPPMLINGKAMIPLRFCAEAFGLYVDWDHDTRVISINEPDEIAIIETKYTPVTENMNTVTFGNYYKNKESNVSVPIEWYVLDEINGKKLLLTKNVVDAHTYHTEFSDVTWDNCELRKWLNENFLKTAFSKEEQAAIYVSDLKAETNPRFPKEPIGKNTKDKVFLLSYQETVKYLPEYEDRLCKPTEYAIANGCYVNELGDAAWWLRSPGMSSTEPEYLATWGNFSLRGYPVNNPAVGVRVAVWVTAEYFN